MAVTIDTSPPAFAFARNPISVKFDVGATAGVAEIEIDCSVSTPNNSSIIELYFENEVVTITYLYTTVTDFYNWLNQHYIIKRYFSVAKVGDVITLTSYTNESLNIDVVTDSGIASCVITVTEGGLTETRVLCAVDTWNGTAFVPTAFDKSHLADNDGIVSFNLSSAFVFDSFEFPDTAFDGFYPFEKSCVQYRLQYSDSTAEDVYLTDTDLFALNGGFSSAYLGTALSSNIFLTASRRSLFNRDDEPRFLAVLATDDLESLVLTVTATEFDGTRNTYTIDLDDINKGQILFIPIYYNALGLQGKTEAPFYKYEVVLSYDIGLSTYNTETFYINCDRRVLLNYSTFLFLNSRGGVDTVSFEGEVERTTNFDGLQTQRSNDDGLLEIAVEQNRLQYSFKQYTGFYDNVNDFNYLEELFNSEKVWWLNEGSLKEIVINRDTFEKGSIHDDIWEAEFEFSLNVDAVVPALDFVNSEDLGAYPVSVIDPTTITLDPPGVIE